LTAWIKPWVYFGPVSRGGENGFVETGRTKQIQGTGMGGGGVPLAERESPRKPASAAKVPALAHKGSAKILTARLV
jgi:hypothetical protein